MSISEKIKNQQAKTDLKKQKLLNGEYGLTKTFWLFWFLTTIVLLFCESMTTKPIRIILIEITIQLLSMLIIKCILKTKGNKYGK